MFFSYTYSYTRLQIVTILRVYGSLRYTNYTRL